MGCLSVKGEKLEGGEHVSLSWDSVVAVRGRASNSSHGGGFRWHFALEDGRGRKGLLSALN